MKKSVSVVAIALLLILSTSGLSACSNSNNASKSSAPEEITAYFLAPQAKDLQKVNDAVNKITEKDINVKVNLVYYDWDSYADKTKLALSAGNAGDVMFTAAWNNYATFVGQQAFEPLDSLLSKYGKDIKKNIEPTYLKGPIIGGKLYAIPTNKDMASEWGVVINKALATKYNMDFSKVTKPEDLEPFLQTIKEKEPGIVPFLADQGMNVLSFAYDYYSSQNAGISILGIPRMGSTKVVNLLDDSQITDLIKVSREFYIKGYTNSDAATAKQGDKDDYKRNQKAFMWVEQLKPGKAEEETSTYGYALLQQNAFPSVKQSVTTSDLCNSMLSIPKSSTHKEAAMKFINELYANKDVQNLLAWGIEGTNYVKTSDGKLDYPTGQDAKSDGYTGIYQWAMGGNQLSNYLWKTESADKWTKMNAWNKAADISPLVGYNLESSKIENQIAAVTNVNAQYWNAISTGSVDLASKVSAYRAGLKTAGIDDIIKECQTQIDAFVKAKK
jgi:putative aldouronate transport system substrate-binding protein